MQAVVEGFSEAIRRAAATGSKLAISGGGSKAFYGRPARAETLDVRAYRGILDYQPEELVITARGGTPLAEIEAAMRAQGQMLAFEPPHFGPATLGGCIAAGLAGPRRLSAGSIRDFVLGVRVLDGRGSDLRFGGQVMKNVAGYDVSRMLVGSLGTLALILEVSLKALPLPRASCTLQIEMPAAGAIQLVNQWLGRPLPISATCHFRDLLSVRLEGAETAVGAAVAKLGGERLNDAESFWESLREHTGEFFAGEEPLWRVSLPSTSAPLTIAGEQLIEWGGALRWIRGAGEPRAIRELAARLGGHATLFRRGALEVEPFQPLAPPLLALHVRLKQALDPHGLFNPGRIYAEL